MAADDSHVEPAEVEYTIGAIVKQIQELMLEGHTVEIPRLGRISLSADGITVSNYDDVRCDSLIKQLRLNLRVTPELRDALKKVSLRMR